MRRYVAGAVLSAVAVGLVPSPVEAEPAAAKSDELCRLGSVDDPQDTGGVLDIRFARFDLDCAGVSWIAYVVTYDGWDWDRMKSLSVWFDTDEDPASGCSGYDFVAEHDGFGGAVWRTPACDEASWELLFDDVRLGASMLEDAWLRFPASVIGAPAGDVHAAIVLEGVGGTVDFAEGLVATAPPPDLVTTASNGRCERPLDPVAQVHGLERLYFAYFGRRADPGGLGYWIGLYRSGEQCLTEISEYFAGSAEFVATYGALDIPGFVGLVYRNVLHREPDPAGYEHWAGQLAAGLPRGTMMVGFSESPEFRSHTQRR